MTYSRGWGKGKPFSFCLFGLCFFLTASSGRGITGSIKSTGRVPSSQGYLILSSPSHLGWCPLRGNKGKILLVKNVTLDRRVDGKSFDVLGVAPS